MPCDRYLPLSSQKCTAGTFPLSTTCACFLPIIALSNPLSVQAEDRFFPQSLHLPMWPWPSRRDDFLRDYYVASQQGSGGLLTVAHNLLVGLTRPRCSRAFCSHFWIGSVLQLTETRGVYVHQLRYLRYLMHTWAQRDWCGCHTAAV